MRTGDALSDLVRRGRRRQVCHALVTAGSLATAVALSGGIVLLLVGTQILNWYWLVLLFAGSLAVGLYRLRKRISSGYKIAQEVDVRLGFHDALSTAHYFAERPDRAGSPPELIAQQRQMAEDLARSADIGRGVPFLPPKTLYLNAALAVLACGMFGLRYGIQRSLDLRPSLVKIAFEGFLGSSRELAEAKRGPQPEDADAPGEKGNVRDQANSKASDQQSAQEPELDQSENNLYKGADAKNNSKASGADQNTDGDDLSEMEKEQSPLGKDGGDSNLPSDSNSQAGKQSENGKNSNGSGKDGDNQSLADKLRDALSNLIAKLKNQPQPNQGKQSSSQSSKSQSGQRKNQTPDGETKSENSEQAEANSDGESQGEQQQGGTEQSEQGKSQGSSSDRPNSPDGKSGIGNQDGDKSAREAAELAAMGKISEIIGKRAANITGEVMVEVSSGKQQLKTQYSEKNATHVDAGGEINRDEVPLAYQQYVQQYFEEIRKLPADKTKAESQEKPKAPGN